MDQNDNVSCEVWDLSRLKNSQPSKIQTTDGFSYATDRNNLGMSTSIASASNFSEYSSMDGAIDMSSKVSMMNKVSVIKNISDESQKISPSKQTSLRNFARTKEKVENVKVRTSPIIHNNITQDLKFRIFGSEFVRKETSQLPNHHTLENSHGLNCNSTNSHSRQHQNSVFPDPAKTYQRYNSNLELETDQQGFNHDENPIWNPAKDLSPTNHRQSSNNNSKKNPPRGSDNGVANSRLLMTVRSDTAVNSSDIVMHHQPNSTVDDVEEVQEVFSISDEDSQGKVDMVEEAAEVISSVGDGSVKVKTKRTILVRDSDPNEEVYFICEDGDDDDDNNNVEEVEDDVEMIDEDEEQLNDDDNDDDNGEEGHVESLANESCQNGYNEIKRDFVEHDETSREEMRGHDVSSSTRSRPRRGRRPRNSLVLSQSRSGTKRDHDDSDEGSHGFSSPSKRRGRGRGAKRGWSNRGRGSSASKRARPMKRGSSVRVTSNGEDDSKKLKKPKMSNMLIADKISNAVAAAATATQNSLLEYQWPQKSKNSEWFVLQEHVSEFLGVVSFKRKYPDISRRPVEFQERQFLCEQGSVTEMQCDLGLTVLKLEEVLDLMTRDYPEKYQEYTKISKKKLKTTDKVVEKNPSDGQASKTDSLLKRNIKSAMKYNSLLLKERRNERQTYFDLQTLEIHHPIGRPAVKYSNAKLCDNYPVSVVPGQFQEYFKSYTPEELKYFPINTALYAPHKIVPSIYADPIETVSDEEEDRTPNNNAAQNNSNTPLPAMKQGRQRTSILNRFPALERSEVDLNGSDSNMSFSSARKAKRGGVTPAKVKKVIGQQARCGMCRQTNRNKYNEPDELVRCNTCAVSNHPGCLGLSKEIIPVIKTYNWQCMECKTCFKCTEPYDEDKMMFCDHCDRGYHTYCVGLVSIPEGRWDCSMCVGKSPHAFTDSSPGFGSPSAFPGKIKPTEASRPKPKRGRPFKYPRDENNIRIVTSNADSQDSQTASGSQSMASSNLSIINVSSNQNAASSESATNSPTPPLRSTDLRNVRPFSTASRITVTSTFSGSRPLQGSTSSVDSSQTRSSVGLS